jgi:DNA-binding PadR family transcriptional regulator
MYPYPNLSKPLPHHSFYILLALSRGELHGYSIRTVGANYSLGTVRPQDGRFYPHLKEMCQDGLIEPSGTYPAGKSDTPRTHYRITKTGLTRLKDELKRMKHAVAIAEHGHLFSEEPPKDLRDLIDSLR